MSQIFVLLDDKKIHEGAKTYYKKDTELFTTLNKSGYGVYFAVNDFGSNPRQDKFCTKLRFAYGDLDIAKAGDGQTREQKDKKKRVVIEALKEKCPPTMIIDTSNGIQPLWKLEFGDPEKGPQYVKVLKGIIEWSKQYGCMGDRVYDIARILRAPNYYHMKEESYLCQVVFESNKTYTIEELSSTFPYTEEVKEFVPPAPQMALSPIDEAIAALDIKDVVSKAYASTGRVASWDGKNRLILDNRLTGTFQGKKDNRDYIASSSHEPVVGNKVTVVADILSINNKEARKWIIDTYNINWAKEKARQNTAVLKEVKPTKDYKLRYTWGTKGLDDSFAIIKRKTFVVFAATRGSGKTTYAFDMACKNALLGHRVLFVSLEMEKQAIKEDFARRRAAITIPEEREYRIPENKMNIFHEKIKEIDSIENLFFSGVQRGSDISWDGVKLLIDEHKDLDLIFIDNLDLIEKNDGEDEWEKQKRVVKNIMNYTADKQVPLVLIHHYKKTNGKSNGMDDLSGSGKIADSADYVVKISRTNDPEAVYPDKYCSHVYMQKARGYNEAAREIYFLGGTFMDEAPKDANPAMAELDLEFPTEKKVEANLPYYNNDKD